MPCWNPASRDPQRRLSKKRRCGTQETRKQKVSFPFHSPSPSSLNWSHNLELTTFHLDPEQPESRVFLEPRLAAQP